jgi:hypothetical protein
MRCNPHRKLRYGIDRNGSAMLFVSQLWIVAKSRALLTSAEVKRFRATVSVADAVAKTDAMVGGLQGVRKVLGFKVSSREF